MMARSNLGRSIASRQSPSTHVGCSQHLPSRIEWSAGRAARVARLGAAAGRSAAGRTGFGIATTPAIAIPIAVLFQSVFADGNPSDDEETFTREGHGRGVRDPRVRERTDLS
jgi:hypothetical protein